MTKTNKEAPKNLSDEQLEIATGGTGDLASAVNRFVASQRGAAAHLVMMLHTAAGSRSQ